MRASLDETRQPASKSGQHCCHRRRMISMLRQTGTRNYFLVALVLAALYPQPAHMLSFSSLWGQESPLQLVDCINEVHNKSGTTWDGAMSDTPASLKAIGAWWSNKPLRIPLTIVTQASANRVTQLWAQCKSWPGPLSAAVYLSLLQPSADTISARNAHLIKQTLKALSDFHLSVERDPTACRLDIVLVYEIYTEKRASILYPVNQLRNFARLQARTELVGLMDVDMLVSSKLARSLLAPSQADIMRTTCSQRTVYVVPAFETYGTQAAQEADRLVRQSKTFLVRSINTGIIAPFDNIRFPMGHNATNFTRWYVSDKQYELTYTARFEPWVIANRKAVPWHDVRFRGYGQNKIVQVAHTNATGFKFVVHPTGFIIHRAHALTAARVQLITDMRANTELMKTKNETIGADTVYGHSKKIWDMSKAQMDAGKYEPVMDPATLNCRSKLPWWR